MGHTFSIIALFWQRLHDRHCKKILLSGRPPSNVVCPSGAYKNDCSLALYLSDSRQHRLHWKIAKKIWTTVQDLVGRIADRGAEYVPAREWMRICFELLEMLKAHKKGIRRATVNTFGYIAKAIGPQDVLVTLLNNLKVQERQNRVCTTVAIAIVAETCSPFTVLPALMNEYKVRPKPCFLTCESISLGCYNHSPEVVWKIISLWWSIATTTALRWDKTFMQYTQIFIWHWQMRSWAASATTLSWCAFASQIDKIMEANRFSPISISELVCRCQSWMCKMASWKLYHSCLSTLERWAKTTSTPYRLSWRMLSLTGTWYIDRLQLQSSSTCHWEWQDWDARMGWLIFWILCGPTFLSRAPTWSMLSWAPSTAVDSRLGHQSSSTTLFRWLLLEPSYICGSLVMGCQIIWAGSAGWFIFAAIFNVLVTQCTSATLVLSDDQKEEMCIWGYKSDIGIVQGLFHPARKVREVYWKIYNNLYIGAQDSLVACYPRLEDDASNVFARHELDLFV